jgi:hypothetical protein
MKKLVCDSCNGNDFKLTSGQAKCRFCGTMYEIKYSEQKTSGSYSYSQGPPSGSRMANPHTLYDEYTAHVVLKRGRK